jgi:hypothetical protein
MINRIKPVQRVPGFTLAETLIGLLLMAAIFIPFYITMGKSKVQVARQGTYRKVNFEVNRMLDNLTSHIKAAHQLKTSTSSQLNLEVYQNGAFQQISWRNNSGTLEFSADGGTTWLSPFANSDANTYTLTLTLTGGTFQFCNLANTCSTTFDSAAKKILISGWSLGKNTLSPEVKFDLPPMYISLPEPGYASDNRLLLKLDTDVSTSPGSSFAGSVFNVADIEFHTPTRQLFSVGGAYTGTSMKIVRTNAEGVLIGSQITVSGAPASAGTSRLRSIAPMFDASKAWILDTGVGSVYQVDLSTGTVDSANSFTYTTIGGLTADNATAVLYDESIPDSFYLIGKNSGAKAYKITRNSTTGVYALDATYTLPTNLTEPTGATLDPVSGDLLVANQTVSTVGGREKIWVYRIDLTSPSTENRFQIDLDSLGSSTGAGTFVFGLAMDALKNRFFLSDVNADSLYYALPDRKLTRTP